MSKEGLAPTILDLQRKVVQLATRAAQLSEYDKHLSTLRSLTELRSKVANASGDSWFTDTFDYYYKDFLEPPEDDRFNPEWRSPSTNWQKRTFEEVSAFIESQVRTLSLQTLNKEIGAIANEAGELRRTICTELSVIHGIQGYEQEAELLKQLEEFKWGMPPEGFVRTYMPSQFHSYDPR